MMESHVLPGVHRTTQIKMDEVADNTGKEKKPRGEHSSLPPTGISSPHSSDIHCKKNKAQQIIWSLASLKKREFFVVETTVKWIIWRCDVICFSVVSLVLKSDAIAEYKSLVRDDIIWSETSWNFQRKKKEKKTWSHSIGRIFLTEINLIFKLAQDQITMGCGVFFWQRRETNSCNV